MSITTAAPGTTAHIGDARRPVLLWQEDADGRVVGLVEAWADRRARGSLVAAEHVDGFWGYSAPEATALLAADGYEAVYGEDDGTESAEPLLGWAVARGRLVGLIVCDDVVDTAEPAENFRGYRRTAHPRA